MSAGTDWSPADRAAADLAAPLGLLLLVVSATPWIGALDIAVARVFFDFETREWLVPAGHPPIWFLLYRAPKILLILVALCLVGLFCRSFYVAKPRPPRRNLGLMLIALGLIPGIVWYLKRQTHMYCPYQLDLFGGAYPYSDLLSAHARLPPGAKPGRCWPAAHASAGFALMGLMLFANRETGRGRLLLAMPGFVLGWVMGLFQMARGHHYLSHTLASLGISLLVIAMLDRQPGGRSRAPVSARRTR